MDNSREADLRHLDRMRDSVKSTSEREKIERVMHTIVESSKDKHINRAREELIQAHSHGAVEETHKIEERIREYEGKHD